MKYTRFQDIPQYIRGGAYEVDIPWDYLENMLERWGKDQEVDLDPDFQRGHVWTPDKQTKYVEYVLRGGKAQRVLYWNCTSWMKNFDTPIVLVDGKQRMEAVRKFLRNELPIFDENTFADFTDRLGMGGPGFKFQINELKTRAEVLQWYLDLNEGGVVHTDAELNRVRQLLATETSQPPPAHAVSTPGALLS